MKDRQADLISIRDRFGLTRAQIALVTGRSHSAVDTWLLPATSSHRRTVPKEALRLLRLELGLAQPRYRMLNRR